MRKKIIILLASLFLLLVVGSLYYLARIGKIKPFAMAIVPELASNPSSDTYSIGQTFAVNITLDTAGKSVDGVDIRYLNYNPQALQVQDADGNSTNGVQIKAGTIFASTPYNNVDSTNGRIGFSQTISGGGTPFTGSGVLATVTFKVLTASSASKLTFNYTPGATIDCNVIEHGTANDVLGSVINGSFVLGNPSTPTPSPTITASPTPGVVTVDIKANGSNGPITINNNKSATLTWVSANATTCTASGSWSGDKPTSGTQTTGALAVPQNYILTCTNGTTSATDNVQVNIRIPGKKK